MSTPPLAPDARFSEVVKKVTWGDHADAQATDYVHQLFRGGLSRDEYAALVVQHYLIYRALEQAAARHTGDAVVGPFLRPELARTATLEADLRELFGADWASHVRPIPTTTRYLERIDEVCGGPQAFLAHHYTRYLGDLSGGQMIGAAVAKTYGFGEGPGASFYRFDGIADPKAYKDEYRAQLDALPWDEASRDAMVAEVGVAYKLNADVLAELGDVVTAARG